MKGTPKTTLIVVMILGCFPLWEQRRLRPGLMMPSGKTEITGNREIT